MQESSQLDEAGMREQHPKVFERLAAIEDALEEDDFEEKTLSEKCKITADQRISSTKTKQIRTHKLVVCLEVSSNPKLLR